MTEPAWQEYLRAAQRLDEVRQANTDPTAGQATAARQAGAELARLGARLVLQQSRLRETVGLAEAAGPELAPTPAEIETAARTVGGDPAAVLDALRRNWSTVEQADAVAQAAQSPAGWSPPLRNLLVYGPLALLVLAVQLALYGITDGRDLPRYASLCGLVMPAVAFGLGYGAIGLIFPARPGGRVDRTPLWGATVCLVSTMVLCAGLGLLAALR